MISKYVLALCLLSAVPCLADDLPWNGDNRLENGIPLRLAVYGGMNSIFGYGLKLTAPSLMKKLYVEAELEKKFGSESGRDQLALMGVTGGSFHIGAGYSLAGNEPKEERFFITDEYVGSKVTHNKDWAGRVKSTKIVTTYRGRYYKAPVTRKHVLMADLWFEPDNDIDSANNAKEVILFLKHRYHHEYNYKFDPGDGYVYPRRELFVFDWGLLCRPNFSSIGLYTSFMGMLNKWFWFEFASGYVPDTGEGNNHNMFLKVAMGTSFHLPFTGF